MGNGYGCVCLGLFLLLLFVSFLQHSAIFLKNTEGFSLRSPLADEFLCVQVLVTVQGTNFIENQLPKLPAEISLANLLLNFTGCFQQWIRTELVLPYFVYLGK